MPLILFSSKNLSHLLHLNLASSQTTTIAYLLAGYAQNFRNMLNNCMQRDQTDTLMPITNLRLLLPSHHLKACVASDQSHKSHFSFRVSSCKNIVHAIESISFGLKYLLTLYFSLKIFNINTTTNARPSAE